ncbi:MAG: signal recognition particle-docking protein FtsY [Thermosynechococcaceae cyanobacterium]
MVFNWFRRQFAPESPETETPDEPTTKISAEEPEVSAESAALTEAETAEEEPEQAKPDYLNWAKTAFANIQQQREEVAETSEAPPLSAASSQNIVAAVVEIESSDVSAVPSEPEMQSAAQPIEELKRTERRAPDDSTEQPEAEGPSAEPSETFVQAATQSDLRSEKEPVSSSSVQASQDSNETIEGLASTAAPEAPLDFDEGFLWSAEVLAAQGRRPEEVSVEEITWLKKLRRGLGKTRQGLVNQLKAAVGQGPLNQDGVTEIETLLLQADVGVAATDRIIEALQTKLREETLPPDEAIDYLKQVLREMLEEPYQQNYSPTIAPERGVMNVWLMTGVNGAGKTTTIGKITHVAKQSGYSCLIAAADTFRAAAVEQVKVWGARSGVDVIANPGQNTDPAAVVYDAIAAAQSRDIDLLLVDTAGRLQNKKNLMDELEKVRRIIDKKAPNAKVESLLVLDATLGQNGLRQAQVFSEAAQLTGVVLTKLDGTAKGGVALAVVEQLGLPIRFIGAGEGISDLRPFSSYEFIEALLSA